MKIAELKRRVPIEDVLEYYGADLPPGTGGSGWRNLRCPFHDDNAMSASVTAGFFICHAGCVQGDILDVVQYAEPFNDVRDAMEFIEKNLLEDE